MPIFKTKKEDFFKRWTPDMAYVLGFFTADGNMIKNKREAHFITIEVTDRDILEKIRETLGSNHKISCRKRSQLEWKDSYRLQIGSKEIFDDLLELGMKPDKSKTMGLPHVPDKYFMHFVRGYFDGDGCVKYGVYGRKDRKTKKYILSSCFTSGSVDFLNSLLNKLRNCANIVGGFVNKKTSGFDLVLSINDSQLLFNFMYKDVRGGLLLERKYNKFREGLTLLKVHNIM